MTERWRNQFPRKWPPAEPADMSEWWEGVRLQANRIRAGARHACARLREERDHFRKPVDELFDLVTDAEARANEMSSELHTARARIAALEEEHNERQARERWLDERIAELEAEVAAVRGELQLRDELMVPALGCSDTSELPLELERAAATRHEVAATRAIEKWLDADPDRRSLERIDGEWHAHEETGGGSRFISGASYAPKATGATMRDLCAALGIEVENG